MCVVTMQNCACKGMPVAALLSQAPSFAAGAHNLDSPSTATISHCYSSTAAQAQDASSAEHFYSSVSRSDCSVHLMCWHSLYNVLP